MKIGLENSSIGRCCDSVHGVPSTSQDGAERRPASLRMTMLREEESRGKAGPLRLRSGRQS